MERIELRKKIELVKTQIRENAQRHVALLEEKIRLGQNLEDSWNKVPKGPPPLEAFKVAVKPKG